MACRRSSGDRLVSELCLTDGLRFPPSTGKRRTRPWELAANHVPSGETVFRWCATPLGVMARAATAPAPTGRSGNMSRRIRGGSGGTCRQVVGGRRLQRLYAPGTNAENVKRYAFCAASYSARNLVGCAPRPGTLGIARSKDFFSISIAFVTIGSMKIGLPR